MSAYTNEELLELMKEAKQEERELAHLDHHGAFWPPDVFKLAKALLNERTANNTIYSAENGCYEFLCSGCRELVEWDGTSYCPNCGRSTGAEPLITLYPVVELDTADRGGQDTAQEGARGGEDEA